MRFAKPSEFCPNKVCPDYQKLQDGQRRRNIIKAGKTCRRSFIKTFDRLFYNKRTPAEEILETLALLAEGSRMSSLTRTKGFKEDTILRWLREAAQHAETLEDVLLKDFRIKRGQLDGLWAYVRHKGGKKSPRNVRVVNSSGRLCSIWIAACVLREPSRRTNPKPAKASLKCSNGVGIPIALCRPSRMAGAALTKRGSKYTDWPRNTGDGDARRPASNLAPIGYICKWSNNGMRKIICRRQVESDLWPPQRSSQLARKEHGLR
jgi:hypothetical protein